MASAKAKLEEAKKDVEELKSLYVQAQRTRVRECFAASLRTFESELNALKLEVDASSEAVSPAERAKTKTACYDVKITNYAWDQSDKFVKLYLNLQGVQDIAKENVKCDFGPRSVELVVNELGGKNHTLLITKLMHLIVPDGSYHKIKKDSVVLFMKKENLQHWPHVLAQVAPDNKKGDKKPDVRPGADPESSLMDMMKQMYDDGDDDMKRTIAKAWTESREKQLKGDSFDL